MKSRTLFLTVSMFWVTCCMLYGQSPEKPWRAFKLGINYVATMNPYFPETLNDHREPFGILTPTFQWGKSTEEWTELTIPFLISNKSRRVSYEEYRQPEMEAKVTGNLKAHFESGFAIERSWLTGKSFFKIPSALGFGAFFLYGRYSFHSDETGLLDFKCRTVGYRPYFSYKLIKTYKHIFFDFQTQLAIQGMMTVYEYQLIKNRLPANTRRNDGGAQHTIGFRFGIGYRW